MTAFFGVHLVLTVVSLTLGTIIGVLGIQALRASSVKAYADGKCRHYQAQPIAMS